MRVDPILAVSNVPETSQWYQAVFNCISTHGGDEFDVLESEDGEVLVCLHKWNEHDHPTMKNPDLSVGNGLLLYFRTSQINEIYQNLVAMGYELDSEIRINPNSGKKEFSLWDPNGYYLTISEFHEYMG